MAIQTQDGVTTITPTAWRWQVGAVLLLFVIPPFGILLAGLFFVISTGALNRIILRRDGFDIRQWGRTRAYAWSEVGDFRVQKVRSGIVNAASMVSFTPKEAEGRLLTKAAKLVSGGTQTISAIGISADKLAALMRAYQTGTIPADTALAPEAKSAPVRERASKQKPPKPISATARVKAAPKERINLGKRKGAVASTKQTPLVQEGGWFRHRRTKNPFG